MFLETEYGINLAHPLAHEENFWVLDWLKQPISEIFLITPITFLLEKSLKARQIYFYSQTRMFIFSYQGIGKTIYALW